MANYFGSHPSTLSHYSYINLSTLDVMVYYVVIVVVEFSCLIAFGRKGCFNNLESPSHKKKDTKCNPNATTIICFLIALISFHIYVLPYGGFKEYLEYSGLLRSGLSTFSNPFSILIMFRNLFFLVSYILVAKIAIRKAGRVDVILFLTSFVYSMLVLYSNKGRLSFAIYLATLIAIYSWIRCGKRGDNKKIFMYCALLGVISIMALPSLSFYLGRSGEDTSVGTLLQELTFPFDSFSALLSTCNYNLRLGIDCIIWPVYLLPQSIWSKLFGIECVSDITTTIIMGAKKGLHDITGEIPADLISTSFLQFGCLGIMMYPVAFVWMGRLFSKLIEITFKDDYVLVALNMYLCVQFFVLSIIYGDPKHIVLRIFPLVVFIIIHALRLVRWRMK